MLNNHLLCVHYIRRPILSFAAEYIIVFLYRYIYKNIPDYFGFGYRQLCCVTLARRQICVIFSPVKFNLAILFVLLRYDRT